MLYQVHKLFATKFFKISWSPDQKKVKKPWSCHNPTSEIEICLSHDLLPKCGERVNEKKSLKEIENSTKLIATKKRVDDHVAVHVYVLSFSIVKHICFSFLTRFSFQSASGRDLKKIASSFIFIDSRHQTFNGFCCFRCEGKRPCYRRSFVIVSFLRVTTVR